MVGLVHRSMDWFQAGWIPGKVMQEDAGNKEMKNFWPNETWWLELHKTVKHIHYYNQLVVYEKRLPRTSICCEDSWRRNPTCRLRTACKGGLGANS
eukprot:scaffold5701_cov155-Skeletonema_dohrnii-CCMP3373.AAC.9